MLSSRQIPHAALCLILASSVAILLLGIRLAKQEQHVPIEQDQIPLSRFTSQFLREIESLDQLYQGHLTGLQADIGINTSEIEIASICRNINGIEQATLLEEGERPRHVDVRDTDRSLPLPLPHRAGDGPQFDGVVVDVSRLEGFTPEPSYFWLGSSHGVLHFVCKSSYNTVLVLRINPEEVMHSAEIWIAQWLKSAGIPLEQSGLITSLTTPDGAVIATTGAPEPSTSPDFLLPIPSRFGDWQLASWNKTKTVTSYHQPMLIGSAVLALILGWAGIFGFAQQQRALRLAEQRVSFVNRVSHELRTPMTNILLNTDLLSDSLPAGDKWAEKRLDLVRDEANRLSRLIENVLTFSRQDRDQNEADSSNQSLRSRPCNLRPAIEEALSQFSPSLSQNNIIPKVHLPPSPVSVLVDPDGLHQILSNLISNVEKYAATGGQFEICGRLSPDGSSVSLTFSDNGPGVPGKEADRIFRPFERLDDTTTEGVSGTGLGLAISHDLARSMGGSLRLEPNPESDLSGAHFTLTLPVEADNIVPIAS